MLQPAPRNCPESFSQVRSQYKAQPQGRGADGVPMNSHLWIALWNLLPFSKQYESLVRQVRRQWAFILKTWKTRALSWGAYYPGKSIFFSAQYLETWVVTLVRLYRQNRWLQARHRETLKRTRKKAGQSLNMYSAEMSCEMSVLLQHKVNEYS